ncbi:DUF1642 domain-containing protein [Enterococcus faecium]|nr:DUF1642 domain-containing protein [Enterococcus faecium]
MNKQELINELSKYVERYEDATDEYYQGKSSAYEVALKLAKKLRLDEPQPAQQPVVPKVVGEYLNYCIDIKRTTLREALITGKIRLPEYFHKAVDWLNDSMNQNIFAQAWLFGYEVKKEPLYEVIIGDLYLIKKFNDRNDFCFDTSRSLCTWEKSAYQLTEAEIKAIDERFWPFAVPVVEVAEG